MIVPVVSYYFKCFITIIIVMAEIASSGNGRQKGHRGSKKLSTRIDLTPMVDLGFLLIAFFMVTTTLAKPRSMVINMPYVNDEDKTPPNKIKAKTALTILPGKDHRIYYYEGIGDNPADPPKLKIAAFKGQENIRKVITAKKKEIAALISKGDLRPKDQLTVLIKPDTTSTYADLVSILDEMNINDVATYAIVDITSLEQAWIKARDTKE